jgi:voltage-dependent calcium channel
MAAVIALSRYRFPYTYVYRLGLDSIALIIIPRFDRLSRAWKEATKSILPLGNIILVWAVCFMVFAIAFTATLSLAPFSADQTWEENFRSVPNSLVLLFSLNTGDDWPEMMESVARVTSSHCADNHGQCVNAASVRALFTIWNILSMYFFANACTAVVYSNTSARSSLPSSKEVVNAVSRDEIRRFKQAWATLDPEGTGYISKEWFPRLLGVSPKFSNLFLG